MRMCDAFIPFLTSALAIWVLATCRITEEKAHEVRMRLEARRGNPELRHMRSQGRRAAHRPLSRGYCAEATASAGGSGSGTRFSIAGIDCSQA